MNLAFQPDLSQAPRDFDKIILLRNFLKQIFFWGIDVTVSFTVADSDQAGGRASLTGIKESDTGLAAPSQWDLVSDKQMMQEEQPLQVRAIFL